MVARGRRPRDPQRVEVPLRIEHAALGVLAGGQVAHVGGEVACVGFGEGRNGVQAPVDEDAELGVGVPRRHWSCVQRCPFRKQGHSFSSCGRFCPHDGLPTLRTGSRVVHGAIPPPACSWRCCRWRPAPRSCVTGCTTWTASSAAPGLGTAHGAAGRRLRPCVPGVGPVPWQELQPGGGRRHPAAAAVVRPAQVSLWLGPSATAVKGQRRTDAARADGQPATAEEGMVVVLPILGWIGWCRGGRGCGVAP